MVRVNFLDLNYRPSESDLICEFYIEPERGIEITRAASAVASESSIGTWTEVKTMRSGIRKLAARVFEIDEARKIVKIAYPCELFEQGNMPQILSSIAGNVFGMKLVKNLRLLDVSFPKIIVKSFPGPKFGIEGIRKLTKINGRPLVGTIVKPKLGLNEDEHARVAYDAWVGGIDIVKDDENLANMRFNRFERRVRKTLKLRDRAERETGERKIYIPNVTAETSEMLKRARFVRDLGGEYVMVDVLTLGLGALQTLRSETEELNLAIHAHRAGHAAVTKNRKHGIAMRVLAKISRIVGVDQLHVGTAVGKMFENKRDVLSNCDALRSELYGIKRTMPVASGGLHPAAIPELIKIFGIDVILQFGGGCHGHPRGTAAGARAIRQSLDATLQNIPLEEYASKHRELREALKKWR